MADGIRLKNMAAKAAWRFFVWRRRSGHQQVFVGEERAPSVLVNPQGLSIKVLKTL